LNEEGEAVTESAADQEEAVGDYDGSLHETGTQLAQLSVQNSDLEDSALLKPADIVGVENSQKTMSTGQVRPCEKGFKPVKVKAGIETLQGYPL
jgi:hypothetical protein